MAIIDRKSLIPMYHQLAQILKEQIDSGIIHPGDKLPSESEMIAQYGIGRLTVRQALAQLAKDDYIEKIQGKGTYCKHPAHKTNAINIDVLLDMSDTYFIPYYVKSISEALSNNNANFIISDTKDSDAEICSLIDKITDRGSSGVILQPSHGLECDHATIHNAFNQLRNAGIPYVMIDSLYDNIDSSYLVLDEKMGGAIACDYLSGLNHKRIAIIYVGKYKDSMLRVNGFVEQMKSRGQDNLKNIRMVERDDTLEDNIAKLMANDKRPTAFFCYNDETALRCLKKLKALNINVPDQVSVLGFDDSLIATNSAPALTTIAHPKGLMGKSAVDGLFDLINHKTNGPYIKVFDPVLIIRDSCKKI